MTYRRARGAGDSLPADRSSTRSRAAALAAITTTLTLVLGLAAASPALAEDVPATAVVAPAQAMLTGDLVVDGTVTAQTEAWTPADAALTYTWWHAPQAYVAPVEGIDQNPGATQIEGAEAASLTLDGTLAGRFVWAVVTGSAEGLTPATVVAAGTTAVRPGILAGPNPTFVGVVKVDSPVTVSPGTWPEGTTFTYKWRLTDAKYVTTYPTVPGDTYTPNAAALGKKLSVIVTASRPGYTPVLKYSAFVVVASGNFVTVPAPKITGATHIGAVLTATPGAASPSASFTYQWRRGGAAIAGGTASTYKLTTADLGRVITVTATARRSGYVTLVRTSVGTAAITRPFAAVYAPTILGSIRVGNVLTASVRAWSPAASFTFQWKRNGVAVAGATKTTYVLTPADLGATISVAVTGKRAGYYTRTYTSASTIKTLPPIVLTKDGLFSVGQQISPGTYIATGGNACYFERRSDANVGEPVGALGWQYNYGGDVGGQKVVTISSTDAYFYTEGCGLWKQPTTALKTSLKDGTWIVGKDLSPGVWQVVGPFDADGCYVEFLNSFTGVADVDITAGGMIDAVGYYRIDATDKGFTTDGCGTWKRIGN